MTTSRRAGVRAETWTWGDLFEIDLPLQWRVDALEGAIELHPEDPEATLAAWIAPLGEGPHGEPPPSPAAVLEDFAASRGARELVSPRTRTAGGVAHATALFVAPDGYFRVHVLGWAEHRVLCAACDGAPSPELELAQAVFATARPCGVVAAEEAELEPDAPGDF